jgi:xylulokinase
MFLSTTFREALACVTGATIDLYDTDGSVGAAKGAGIGAGIYKDSAEAFSTLKHISTTTPNSSLSQTYADAYGLWKERLELNKH